MEITTALYATSTDRAAILARPRGDRAMVLRVIAARHDRRIPGQRPGDKGPRWVWLHDLAPQEQDVVAWLEAKGFVTTSQPANLLGDPTMVTATRAGIIVGRRCDRALAR